MRKKRLILLFIVVCIVAIGGIAGYHYKNLAICYVAKPTDIKTTNNNELELTTEEKLEDFKYMYKILKENFPFFEIEKRKTGYDWLAHKDDFENEIKETKNDLEFYKKLNEIVTRVQNAHTAILDPEWYEDFKNIPLTQWSLVINNENVSDKYKY